MSDFAEVTVIVEGRTEQIFVESLLGPYLGTKNIFIRATQVTKPGQKGGDVQFSRVLRDIGKFLKQRSNLYITTMVDYYGVRDWPGLENTSTNLSSLEIEKIVSSATVKAVENEFPEYNVATRFVPYMAMHEFEALLFCDPAILSASLGVPKPKIIKILQRFSSPEDINNSIKTAPSKRLDNLSENGLFAKTTMGIDIARKIGIVSMRRKAPIFDAWLRRLESLVGC